MGVSGIQNIPESFVDQMSSERPQASSVAESEAGLGRNTVSGKADGTQALQRKMSRVKLESGDKKGSSASQARRNGSEFGSTASAAEQKQLVLNRLMWYFRQGLKISDRIPVATAPSQEPTPVSAESSVDGGQTVDLGADEAHIEEDEEEEDEEEVDEEEDDEEEEAEDDDESEDAEYYPALKDVDHEPEYQRELPGNTARFDHSKEHGPARAEKADSSPSGPSQQQTTSKDVSSDHDQVSVGGADGKDEDEMSLPFIGYTFKRAYFSTNPDVSKDEARRDKESKESTLPTTSKEEIADQRSDDKTSYRRARSGPVKKPFEGLKNLVSGRRSRPTPVSAVQATAFAAAPPVQQPLNPSPPPPPAVAPAPAPLYYSAPRPASQATLEIQDATKAKRSAARPKTTGFRTTQSSAAGPVPGSSAPGSAPTDQTGTSFPLRNPRTSTASATVDNATISGRFLGLLPRQPSAPAPVSPSHVASVGPPPSALDNLSGDWHWSAFTSSRASAAAPSPSRGGRGLHHGGRPRASAERRSSQSSSSTSMNGSQVLPGTVFASAAPRSDESELSSTAAPRRHVFADTPYQPGSFGPASPSSMLAAASRERRSESGHTAPSSPGFGTAGGAAPAQPAAWSTSSIAMATRGDQRYSRSMSYAVPPAAAGHRVDEGLFRDTSTPMVAQSMSSQSFLESFQQMHAQSGAAEHPYSASNFSADVPIANDDGFDGFKLMFDRLQRTTDIGISESTGLAMPSASLSERLEEANDTAEHNPAYGEIERGGILPVPPRTTPEPAPEELASAAKQGDERLLDTALLPDAASPVPVASKRKFKKRSAAVSVDAIAATSGGVEEVRETKQRKAHEGDDVARRLACPYFKHNPKKYKEERSCVGPGWRTVHRVKEHLYRCHALPTLCARCHETFADTGALSQHMRSDPPCKVSSEPLLVEGFTPAQEKQLRSRKQTRKDPSEEERWGDVYRILFPKDDEEAMPSAYYEVKDRVEDDGSLVAEKAELGRYEEFLRQELPCKVRQELENRIDALAPAALEDALKGQLVNIVHDLQVQLFEAFKASRGPMATAPDAQGVMSELQVTPSAGGSTTSPSTTGSTSFASPPATASQIGSSSGKTPDPVNSLELGPGPSWSGSPNVENAFMDFDGALFEFVMPPMSDFSGDSAGDSGYGGSGIEYGASLSPSYVFGVHDTTWEAPAQS